jgi:ABC-2 type transport system permease protein
MKHIGSVAGRELRSLFVSPVAYAVLSLFAALAGLFFVLNVAYFDNTGQQLTQYQSLDPRFAEQLQQLNLNDHLILPFYDALSVVLLFLVPGITMGVFASEKTNGTLELLLTSPLTIWDIVLGKFAGAAAFVALLVALVGTFPALLFAYGDPEPGKTLSGLLGLLLVGWVYTAIGCFASSLTRSQVIAFLISFVLLLSLLLLPAIAQLGVVGDAAAVGSSLRWISSAGHFQQLLSGLVDTSDLAYFAVVIGSFLLLTKAAVESVRWR